MCEAVEEYARERAEKNVRNLFANGVDIEVVLTSFGDLSKERIWEIYDEVMSKVDDK